MVGVTTLLALVRAAAAPASAPPKTIAAHGSTSHRNDIECLQRKPGL
jgi:hypothetical protein